MAIINKYNKFILTQLNGGQDTTGSSTAGAARVVDFDTDTIKVMLCTSAYVPSATAHAARNSVTNEVSGAGYTAGGVTLSGVTVTDVAGTITFDANDVVFAQNASGFTNARIAVIYKDTGTAATSTLIGWIDLVSDRSTVQGSFTLNFAGTGLFTWA